MKKLFESFRSWTQPLEEVKIKDLKAKYPEQEDALDTFVKQVENKYLPFVMAKYAAAAPQDEVAKRRAIIDLVRTAKKFDNALKQNSFDKLIKTGAMTPQEKDISYWVKKDLEDLSKLLSRTEQSISGRKERSIAKEDVDKVYEDERFLILSPKTHKASCFYGKGTKWCISAKNSPSPWDDYTSEGLYFLFLIDSDAADPLYGKVAFVHDTTKDDIFVSVYDAADHIHHTTSHVQESVGAESWPKLFTAMRDYIERRDESRKQEAAKERQAAIDARQEIRAKDGFFELDLVRFSDKYIQEIEDEVNRFFQMDLAEKAKDGQDSVEMVKKAFGTLEAYKETTLPKYLKMFFGKSLRTEGFEPESMEEIKNAVGKIMSAYREFDEEIIFVKFENKQWITLPRATDKLTFIRETDMSEIDQWR